MATQANISDHARQHDVQHAEALDEGAGEERRPEHRDHVRAR